MSFPSESQWILPAVSHFKEQLLQQQKQLQEQLMKLQLQGGRGYSSEDALKNQGRKGEERLGEEWKAMQKRVKEMEALLEREKADHSEKQVGHMRNNWFAGCRKLEP